MSIASVIGPYSTLQRYVRSGVYPIAWAGSVSETDDVILRGIVVVGNAHPTFSSDGQSVKCKFKV